MPKYSLEELQDIAARQHKVYGDALDRITLEIRKHGLNDLADYVQRIKVLYGLGKFEVEQRNRSEFVVRPHIDEHEGIKQVYNFLFINKGKRFKVRDIRLNVGGRFSDQVWKKIREELLAEGRVKASGSHGAQVYWIE